MLDFFFASSLIYNPFRSYLPRVPILIEGGVQFNLNYKIPSEILLAVLLKMQYFKQLFKI